jgi:DNA-binding NarL/FixJ family response regulator
LDALTEKLKILIVDDHQIVLDGLVSLLLPEKLFEIQPATTGVEGLKLAEKDQFDIFLVDISMPVMDGIEMSKQLLKKHPNVKIIILTTHNDREIILEMLHIGVSGYVVKNSSKQELLTAIQKVKSGKSFFSDDVHEALRKEIIKQHEIETQENVFILTKREKEIIELLAKEYTNERIADELNISYRTVETHRKNIMQKTNSHNLAGLLKYFYSSGLLK